MISILQNEVERLHQSSDELAAQVVEYLAAGGKIDTSGQSKPRPEALSGLKQPPTFHRPSIKSDIERQVARVREMAPTMSRRDICEKEGITLGVLKGIAGRYGSRFRSGRSSQARRIKWIQSGMLSWLFVSASASPRASVGSSAASTSRSAQRCSTG